MLTGNGGPVPAVFDDIDDLYDHLENSSAFYNLQSWFNASHLLRYYDYGTNQAAFIRNYAGVVVVFGLALLAGVFGNGLVVYVVIRHGAMKTVTNLFFVNLAVADLLFLTFCVPFTAITYVLPEWPFGLAACKAVNYSMVVSMTSSVMTLVAMGIDRYHAVVNPVHSRAHRTVRRTGTLLASIWMVNLVTMVPVATISRLEPMWEVGSLRYYCVVFFNSAAQRQAYTLSLFLLYYVVPVFIIGLCYSLMAKNLLSRVRPGSLGDAAMRSGRARRRIAKMVLVVMTTFAICWLPIHYVHLRSDFGPPQFCRASYVIRIVAHCMAYANSAINPVIYSFMSKNFRECFRLAFCCKNPSTNVVFFVAEHGAAKIPSSSHQNGSGTKTSSEPRTPRDQVVGFNIGVTSLPDPVVDREEQFTIPIVGSVL